MKIIRIRIYRIERFSECQVLVIIFLTQESRKSFNPVNPDSDKPNANPRQTPTATS
ncbi:MAG TPA: hypothetical protein GX005_07800 [Bacteroidales bacterium]|nr:hypothetical protein [Bacteroidales bacterium]